MHIYLILFWRDDYWYNRYRDPTGLYLVECWEAATAHAWRNYFRREGYCWTILLNVDLNDAMPPAFQHAPGLDITFTTPDSAVRPREEDNAIVTVLHSQLQ